MIKPPSLRPGSKVGIVATGKKVSREDIMAAVEILTSWGLSVVEAPRLFSDLHPYLAGTDSERLHDIQSMLDSEEIEAVICARGGYGTTRIVDKVSLQAFLARPKWVVGFSDVTALHLKIFNAGVESIHGIMPILFSNPESGSSIESLKQILFGTDVSIHTTPCSANRPGISSGRIVGGNLSLIADSLGTQTEPDLGDKILVIEEVDEYIYKIDRMLTQLNRAGKLDKLAGLVVGHITDLKDSSPGFGRTLEEIILEKVSDFAYPVAFGFPIGHANPNLAWRHGSTMTLHVEPSGSHLYPGTKSV